MGGWFVVTDEPPIDKPALYHQLSEYFAELGESGWELISMTSVPFTDQVVLVFKPACPFQCGGRWTPRLSLREDQSRWRRPVYATALLRVDCQIPPRPKPAEGSDSG